MIECNFGYFVTPSLCKVWKNRIPVYENINRSDCANRYVEVFSNKQRK